MYKNASRYSQHYVEATGNQPSHSGPVNAAKKNKHMADSGQKSKRSRVSSKSPAFPLVACLICDEMTNDLHDHIRDRHGAEALVDWILSKE
jgi:hypothetical protein